MIVSVWSERVRNSVSKWLAEDVCILHGIMEIKNICNGQWYGNSSGGQCWEQGTRLVKLPTQDFITNQQKKIKFNSCKCNSHYALYTTLNNHENSPKSYNGIIPTNLGTIKILFMPPTWI